jgi:hypothetical protein
MLRNAVPLQIDNTATESRAILHKLHHIWTPDVRVLTHNGDELYRWDGYLPPFEYTPRMLCGFALANLRTKRFDNAEKLYVEVLKRFPTSYAAPEAQYYLGITRYRRDPDGDDLLEGWAQLRSRYPNSEYRVKQSFKEIPEQLTGLAH